MPVSAFSLDKSEGKRSWLGNPAYYLMEYPQGPGLSAERVKRMLGARNRRHVTKALDTFLKNNPEAPGSKGIQTENGPRISLRGRNRVWHH